MPTQLKLTLAYEGTHYFGWQKTPTGPSIEGELAKVLETILQHPVHLEAASRTDRGVHALHQIACFHTDKEVNLDQLHISLCQLLPPDICVKSIEPVPLSFHPTLDVSSKTYTYALTTQRFQLPQNRLFEWHYPHPLNKYEMDQTIRLLVGTHDFQALTNAKKNETYESTVRIIDSIEIAEHDSHFLFTITGPHFLYKMVRNIVGLLVYVGAGKIEREEVESILKSKDRKLAGVTAPAKGLTLQHVQFTQNEERTEYGKRDLSQNHWSRN